MIERETESRHDTTLKQKIMKEKNEVKIPEKKTILSMVKDLLRKKEPELDGVPSVPEDETVERLIGKASVNGEEKRGCPYATKRAIVASLQEIRRFAEEHQLASTVVKALLTLLAEIALDALKGKVSGRILEALLKALNYDRDKKTAYSEGRKEGANDKIEMVHFADKSDEVPNINGAIRPNSGAASIFDIAKAAQP